jgi:hypothetical protein
LRNNESVLGVRGRSGAPTVLEDKPDCSDHDVVTAVVGAHRRGRRWVLMRTSRRRGVVTPDLTQQASVLPNRQRKHDGEKSRSKHVMLAILKSKSRASSNDGRR